MDNCTYGSLLLIDNLGAFQDIVCDRLNLRKHITNNLGDIIHKDSYLKFFKFVMDTCRNKAELLCEINVYINSEIKTFYFTGFFYENKILVFITECSVKLINLYDELTGKNNELLNSFRILIKEQIEHSNPKNISNDSLIDEISHLNNELTNAQRDLVKKNYQLEVLNKRLEDLSFKDSLTMLYNRRFFYEIIENEIAKIKRLNYSVSIISVDINNFKRVNDIYGHIAGDELLISFKDISLKNIRNKIDYLFRFGGDEFLFLLINSKEEDSKEVINRINLEFMKIYSNVSLSYGIVEINDINVSIDIDNLLMEADKKMYAFKRELKTQEP